MKIGIKLQSLIPIFIYCFSAEKQGFEPWEQLPVHRISSAARSTTPASLQFHAFIKAVQICCIFPNQSSIGALFFMPKTIFYQ